MKQFSLRKSALAISTAALIASPLAAQACGAEPMIGEICTFAFNYCPYGFLAADGSIININTNQALFSLLGTYYGGNGTTNFGLPDLRGRVVVGTGTGVSNTTPATSLTPVTIGQKSGLENITLNANQIAQHTHPATFTGTSGSAQASGNVTLPVTVNIPGQNVSVSGSVKIASSTANGAQAVSSNAVLAKGGAPATIYAPSTVTADTNIGPTQTFTGTSAATSVSTSASGTVTLPVTGSMAAGTVAVGVNASNQAPVPTIPPRLGLTVCIATQGIYPQRP